jgi:hypothetical protein
MFNFPEILSDNLSYFIPGSNLMSTWSVLFGARVSFSVAQLKGGSINRLIDVGRGPPFEMSRVLEIGIDATPFSQRYLK